MMKTNIVIGMAIATAMTFGMSLDAAAQKHNREANLQAMRWYAQQQMAQGLPNPYPGVDLWTGRGFNRNNNYNQYGYGNQYGYNQYGYGNRYGYNQYGYANPYYGTNVPPSGFWF